MQFSDLHIHSRYSDGLLWPEQIINICEIIGVKCISITDHDTVDSQIILENLKNKCNITSIPGIELSTEYNGMEIHILGYFIDIHNNDLNSVLSRIKESRINRAKEIILKLNMLDFDISFTDLEKCDGSVGRPHIARALVNKGLANNTKEVFQKYLIKGKPCYVERYKINYKEALKLINKCSGIAVLAHPGEIYQGMTIENIIKEFRVYGLSGIEVFHPSHSLKQSRDYYNLSKKYSLIISGGSDCHGIIYNDKLLLGSVGLDKNLTYKFLRSCYKK